MGNMYSSDTELMKAYSTFEIQVDYSQLMMDSHKDLLKAINNLSQNYNLQFTNIPSWPGPPTDTYHQIQLDNMLEDFKLDYSGPIDSTYYSKEADYRDTIMELIKIEEGGNFYQPPQILAN